MLQLIDNLLHFILASYLVGWSLIVEAWMLFSAASPDTLLAKTLSHFFWCAPQCTTAAGFVLLNVIFVSHVWSTCIDNKPPSFQIAPRDAHYAKSKFRICPDADFLPFTLFQCSCESNQFGFLWWNPWHYKLRCTYPDMYFPLQTKLLLSVYSSQCGFCVRLSLQSSQLE